MQEPLCPLKLKPVHKDYVWGGHRIPALFGREESDHAVAESWEISARPEGESLVAGGPFDGRSLGSLCAQLGERLMGTQRGGGRFPLLVKLIDAAERLSVQVHPDDRAALLSGGEAKSEMWYVLCAEPDACVFAGLSTPVGLEAFEQRLRQGDTSILKRIPVRAGDALYIPGGLVHAIGAGCLMLEVQQNSNTTYRIYDWGRTLSDGSSRELHIAEASKVIHWNVPAPVIQRGVPIKQDDAALWEDLVDTPYFWVGRLTFSGRTLLPCRRASWHGMFVVNGKIEVEAGSSTMLVRTGETVLVPAEVPCCSLRAGLDAQVIMIALSRPVWGGAVAC